ncbi:hypothetical protein SLEP1_g25823 [Rubroshorea leprosula]|uniref:F-box associated beta-propeller type 3 domain-containing protein n=1 Tax=Rubroshorea leprosula TaxID=152421 RepID=A0AAV5JUM1_9ROSI|nr:hypothetical protein SLEP1_g25823 [Rubroshorea leprosula]
MDLLPSEVIIDILSRLPITSLAQFKITFSSGRALAADRRLPAMFLNWVSDANPYLIMINLDPSAGKQLYFVESDVPDEGYSNTTRKTNPLRKVSNFDLICNPFVRDSHSIELPIPNRFMNQREVFGFGFHPRSREFKVIRIVFYDLIMTGQEAMVTVHNSEVQVFTTGTTEWRKKGASPYLFEPKPSEALVEGSLHWTLPSLGYPCIISFELAEEAFQKIPLPRIGFYSTAYHLCVLNGRLSIAGFIHGCQLDIWVMKEYNVKESWVKEFCITTNYAPLFFFDGQNNAPLGMLIEDLASSWVGRCVRVLCVLKNGEIVLECNKKALVSYDPETNRFNALKINRLPQQSQIFDF